VDPRLQTLIELQGSTRYLRAEAEAARLPKQIESIQARWPRPRNRSRPSGAARRHPQGAALQGEGPRVISAKRSKLEARLYEVKTNKGVLRGAARDRESKQEKAKRGGDPRADGAARSASTSRSAGGHPAQDPLGAGHPGRGRRAQEAGRRRAGARRLRSSATAAPRTSRPACCSTTTGCYARATACGWPR